MTTAFLHPYLRVILYFAMFSKSPARTWEFTKQEQSKWMAQTEPEDLIKEVEVGGWKTDGGSKQLRELNS